VSAIQWTDTTWNPVRGCSVVSPGCTHCYAMKQAHRFSAAGQQYAGLTKLTNGGPVWTGAVRLVPEKLDESLRWRKPRRVFVNSMSDLFHEGVPDEYVAAVFGVMAAAPQHDFQVLTKRPERMRGWFAWLSAHGGIGPYIRSHAPVLRGYFASGKRTEAYRGRTVRSSSDAWRMVFNAAACVGAGPLPNVWLGVSVEDQARADERIPPLLQTPAAVRFLSVEPLLGPVNLDAVLCRWRSSENEGTRIGGRHEWTGLHWVIVGGESGYGARPCDVSWVRSVVAQCKAAGVACFVKQLGSKPTSTSDRISHRGDRSRRPCGFYRYLNSSKGGDPAEWPSDLHVREWPVK